MILFDTKLKDPSCPFVIGKRKTFNSLPTKLLNMMTEGFWWGFVATCLKTGKKIKIVGISAKNKNKKRKFPIDKKIFFSNPLNIIKNKNVNILFELIGLSDGVKVEVLSGIEMNDKIKIWNKTEPIKIEPEESAFDEFEDR